MKKKNIIILITVLVALFFLFAGYFIYKDNKLKESNNVIIPKVKYTCTTTAINADDMIYYTKIVIEGTNAGRIVNYYSGIETLYKNDALYEDEITKLTSDNNTSYQSSENNSIYTYNKADTDENNNKIISKTIVDMNNKNIKCLKEKINS